MEDLLGSSCCAPWDESIFAGNDGLVKTFIQRDGQELLDLNKTLEPSIATLAALSSYNFGSLLIRASSKTASKVLLCLFFFFLFDPLRAVK